jgi:hypothetical protein
MVGLTAFAGEKHRDRSEFIALTLEIIVLI